MIDVESKKGNVIYYSCECGAKGRCIIKPLGNGDTLLVDVKCAICDSSERVTLVKEGFIVSDTSSMTWSLVLTNDIINEN